MLGVAAALSVAFAADAYAVGTAVAENFIGWDPHGTTSATYTTDDSPASVATNAS